ncbi:hypothetical protein PUN4_780018 [Paraburkholderia unamae]|nr:hypothetical protein PUN4_780018 [Paraburkholderia unamae]
MWIYLAKVRFSKNTDLHQMAMS